MVGDGGVEIDYAIEPKRCSLGVSKVLPYQLALVMLGRGCASFSVRALQESKKPHASARSSQEIHAMCGSFPSSFPLCRERAVFVP